MDGSAVYYVVDSLWVNKWKTFIKEGGPMPNEIDNTGLRNFIISWRQQKVTYNNTDNDIELVKQEDYYEFPYNLWKFFYDIYGCRPIIVIRYFT